MAFQKRQMKAENKLFMMNSANNSSRRFFEGESFAPVIPSLQAAYVINDKWSVSAQFAVGGGGGKCEFDNGLPMFEELVGGAAYKTVGTPVPYSLNQNLIGEQYFYGIQLGGTYKFTDNLSVFGGVRGVIASCGYEGAISGIKVNGMSSAEYSVLSQQAAGAAQQYAAAAEQYAAAGLATEAAQAAAAAQQYAAAATQAGTAAALTQDYLLDCSQSGFGITPIIGVDWKLGKWNLAAKYEFRTKINLENESTNTPNVDALMPAYADGAKVRSDIPALLTVGAQYEPISQLRASVGFHYYWDKDAKGTAIKNGDNTWEALFGVEGDITNKVTLSFGAQRTSYGFDDSDMADTNFNICSTAVCVGGAYKFNENMKLNIGYMHSFYDNHEFVNANGTACNYTRKNDVLGVSLDMKF
jgi:long-subunit fatty acid transport protein